MNKKKGIVIGTVATTLILGFSAFQSSAAPADPKLSTDEVRELISIEYPGEIIEFELEEENGRAVYELEIIGEGAKYELEVDGDSGQVLRNKEKTITTKKLNATSQPEDVISIEEAKEIAYEEFAGTVTELELDKDDDRLVYELELRDGNREAEMEIDAITGDLLELEIDLEEDDDEEWDD